MKYGKINRHKKTKPKRNRAHWCFCCDREIVRTNERCPMCGCKEKNKHMFPSSRNLIDYKDE